MVNDGRLTGAVPADRSWISFGSRRQRPQAMRYSSPSSSLVVVVVLWVVVHTSVVFRAF